MRTGFFNRSRGFSLLISLLGLFVAACNTSHFEAQDAMDAGQYEKAAELYQQLVEQKPDDKEAQQELMTARNKVVSQRLEAITQARKKEKREWMADAIVDLNGLIKKWDHKMLENHQRWLAKEISFLEKDLRKEVFTHLKKGHPLPAKFALEKAEFFKKVPTPYFKKLSKFVQKKGRAHCKKLYQMKEPTFPNYNRLVHRYCGYWNIKIRGLASADSDEFDTQIYQYKATRVMGKVKGLGPSANKAIEEKVHGKMDQTPWYTDFGQRILTVQLSGEFKKSKKKNRLSKVHNYTRTDAGSGRTKPGRYPYKGIQTEQFLFVDIRAEFQIGGKKYTAQIRNSAEEKGFSHQAKKPKIGLFPEKANLSDPDEWLGTHILALVDQIHADARESWEESYCRSGPHLKTTAMRGEQVEKCMIFSNKTYDFVDVWYEQEFGFDHQNFSNSLKGTKTVTPGRTQAGS